MAARRRRRPEGDTHGEHVRDISLAMVGLFGFGALMYELGRGSKPDCAAELAQRNTQLLLYRQQGQQMGISPP